MKHMNEDKFLPTLLLAPIMNTMLMPIPHFL